MLLSISSQPSRCKSRTKRTLNLQCDVCGRKYEKKYVFHIEFATHYACSRTCGGISQQLGGVIDEKKRQTFRDRYGIDMKSSIVIGDKLTDIQAGRDSGVGRAFLVESGHAITNIEHPDCEIVKNLFEVSLLLSEEI